MENSNKMNKINFMENSNKMNTQIENLLDDNINLMNDIVLTLSKNDNSIDNIENNNDYISQYNLKNWNILNRISNIWNRFFIPKEKDIEIICQMKDIENYENFDNKYEHLKYYSNTISKKIDEQNKKLKNISTNIDKNNNNLQKNNIIINKLNKTF